jgi:hypothetical protein
VLSALTPPAPPRYEYITRDYNFAERLGIGLLNITFGIGSFIYEDYRRWDNSAGIWILTYEILLGGIGVTIGGISGRDSTGALIGAGIGFGIPALVGFVRAFTLHTEKRVRVRVSSFPAVNVNVVPTSSNNLGVRVLYSWRIK